MIDFNNCVHLSILSFAFLAFTFGEFLDAFKKLKHKSSGSDYIKAKNIGIVLSYSSLIIIFFITTVNCCNSIC